MTGGPLKSLGSRAIIGAFNKRLEERTQASWAAQLAMMLDSNQETETIAFLSDTPAMQERRGATPAQEGLKPYSFTITNKEWTAPLNIKSTDLRRDKTGQIMVRINELAGRAAALPQKVLSTLLNANGNAYDGVAYYHASGHLNANGDTIDNLQTVAAATGVIPTNAEMETAIFTAIEKILGWKDDAGEPRNEFAQAFAVMVPTTLWKQANAALKNDFIAAGTSNSIKAAGFQITPIMNPRLTSQVQIHVFRADSDVKPLVWQDEVMPAMEVIGAGSEYEKIHKHQLFMAERTGNGGYGRFDQACRVEFT